MVSESSEPTVHCCAVIDGAFRFCMWLQSYIDVMECVKSLSAHVESPSQTSQTGHATKPKRLIQSPHVVR